MGCIMSSKPSTHHQVIIPNHHLLTHVPPPSNTNHTIHELTPPKHDHQHTLTIHTNNNNLKVDNALERYSSFHTVEEYDELLQRITNHNDAELTGVVPVPVPVSVSDTTDSACEKETRDNKKQDMEFQTVASLRQWLNAPSGGGDADAAATIDYTALKASFSFYESNSKSMMWGPEENSVMVKNYEEEESIVELVAAFDKYMQQLQIDEDNILKQIHNMNAV
ncbi:hypothetical protein HanRHA438_Chr03g0131991 [Helianthus annuus]|nr:hypothetical protein HanRHA438_Chr03g0131991 [Helianthus annuus]